MGLRIQNNVEAFNTHRQLSVTSTAASKSMEKLSSGYRINRAADDAAGLAISEKMRGQIGGLAQAQRNAQDGISLVQTAEGALNEVHSMLQRVRDLKVQYENDTLSSDDKTAIRTEGAALASEIVAIQDKTAFNGVSLLKGAQSTVSFQVGANDGEQIGITFLNLSSAVGTSYSTLTTGTNADISEIDAAITAVSQARSQMGAVQNRLDHTLSVSAAYQENLTSAESRIRDVDMAEEMVNLTKMQVLQQAGTAMLAQANQSPQNVLKLLG
jgi:flagellin